jgi:hypothetical protein
MPTELVYAGFSFGVLPAQELAQRRLGARGALLFYSCLPVSGEWAFGPWPNRVAVQIHGMDNDPIFVGEGDINAARETWRQRRTRSFFCTPVINTTLPTTRSPRMIQVQPDYSSPESSSSWIALTAQQAGAARRYDH